MHKFRKPNGSRGKPAKGKTLNIQYLASRIIPHPKSHIAYLLVDWIANFFPAFSPEVYFLFTLFKIPRNFSGQPYSTQRTSLYARLFSFHPTPLAPIGGIKTQITGLTKPDFNIIWVFFKRTLDNLNSGLGEIFFPLMNQRAGKHAGHTSLALFGISQKTSTFIFPVFFVHHLNTQTAL